MARKPRKVFAGVPHHITQRGSRKQQVFFCDQDYIDYITDLQYYSEELSVEIVAYCLMTNHIHQIVVPSNSNALEKLYKTLHTNYAWRINKRFGWSGHLWQCRFFSSPLDDTYFLAAVRYTELNPVRANMVSSPEDHPWSSARARILGYQDPLLKLQSNWNRLLPKQTEWLPFLLNRQCKQDDELRKHSKRNLPTGSPDFVAHLESLSGVNLQYHSVGRPRKR